jgi:hypothetical protein
MTGLRPVTAGVFLVCSLPALCVDKSPVPGHLPSAESVMDRVAINQDIGEAQRAQYVYVQHAKMTSRRGNSVMCEEITEYRFTPSTDGTDEQLLKVEGRRLFKHNYIAYTTLLARDEEGPQDSAKPDDQDAKKPKDEKQKDSDPVNQETLDRDLVENIRWNLVHDKSKDGINAHLFPLTSKDQLDYAFHMVGREHLNGRDVFHISFRPKNKDDFGWSGDAFIDTTAFQPVLVTTGMARKIPFAVRTFLGTNFPGLGFTVTYAPQSSGVWFPVNLSTEFKIHVLFFFNREIILDAQNRDFEKTHVTSRIVGDATPVDPKQP